jgi:uncharacterized membrane protein
MQQLAGGLSFRHLAPLIAAMPMLMMNILSDAPTQRNLVHQYSLPILPFLMLAVIAAIANGASLLRNRRAILAWSLVSFLVLAKYTYFGSRYLSSLDNWRATNAAIAQVNPNSSVLTSHEVIPHLSHRALINFPNNANVPLSNLAQFDSVLLNLRHPGWLNTPESTAALVKQLQADSRFHLGYQRDDVYLFTQQ